jgi:tetratricopeptide (TPR) repeat protein
MVAARLVFKRMEFVTSYEEARKLSGSGRFQMAADHFRRLAFESDDSMEKANYLIEEAECLRLLGEFEKASTCVLTAKELVRGDVIASAQVEFFAATLLLTQNQRDDGLQALSTILKEYSNKLEGEEGRDLYKQIQMQRGFTSMHLGLYEDARPILEEVSLFEPPSQHGNDVHCQLGLCYFELGLYTLAREQFYLVRELGVSDEWASTYHYYFGYVFYKVEDFAAAKRELLLCLQSGTEDPPQSSIYKLLAATYRKLGEPKQARLYEQSTRPS